MQAATVSVPLVQALENAWDAIQQQHAEVPDVVVTIGSGTIARGLKLGHFAANTWTRDGDDSIHELFVGAEGLKRGAQSLMGTLLHEAAHAAAEAQGIQDTSRNGRYHNRNFKAVAESFGLVLEHSETLGWSTTTMPDTTAGQFEDEILDLDASITAYRRGAFDFTTTTTKGTAPMPTLPTNGRKSNNNGVVLECGCETPRKIRVSRKVADLGPINCGECGQQFTE